MSRGDQQTEEPPRLLYIGHNLPFPPHEGALIRSYNTVRLLSRFTRLSGLYFYRRSAIGDEYARERAVNALSEFGEAAAFPVPQEYSRIRWVWDHIRSVATGTAYTRWAHADGSVRDLLRRWLRERPFDLIHVDSIDLMTYLPDLQGQAPVVLAHHNVESRLLMRRAEAYSGVEKTYLRHQSKLVEQAERRWSETVDLNVLVSPNDQAELLKIAPESETLVIPNGVDTSAFTPSTKPPRGGILFVGGHAWFPNADGMQFFAHEILPIVRRELPDISVKWIGKAPDSAVREFAELGIEMLGYVDDIRPEMDSARCTIVPLRVGGGTRLKILDAWALGKAVISTTLGCEGLATSHGLNILIADEPADFARQVVRVLEDDRLRQRLEANGRRTAEEEYDWDVLGEKVRRAYLELVAS